MNVYISTARTCYICMYMYICKVSIKSNVDPRHEPSVWGKVLTSTMCTAGAALLHLFQSNTLLLPNLNVLNGSTLIAV